jgi:excisionase family DNA binding protein
MAPKTIVGTRRLEEMTYLTCAQAAELLQVSEEHIRRKIRAGEMPGAEKRLGVIRVRTAALLGTPA